jgi:hypothetical protein
MPDPVFYYFPDLGIILCGYHKDRLIAKDPRHSFDEIEPGSQIITEWCNSCTDIMIQYTREMNG